ncbi:hypothetical protein NQ534_01300 [Marvinbryantia formatexigens DSM 14469]|uniref:IS66 family insertion sequence element accessory protein TnpA n=1 Tax=Marvinbryantia formatexigens TaxID=168384 RepID=UPI0021A3D9E9|nr:hypothetical protein [Marvinbryantia formatexigens]UWO25159.1 hypothetical protein NQ534_01300 [Marvinbryantia formatexigens DSM 14469]
MMEVMIINMNDNAASKTDPWTDWISAFQASGLSRKDWCKQNGGPQSTLGYWIRKIQSEVSEKEEDSETVFAKLPSVQEIRTAENMGNSPVAICLPENIRIEIGADCPSRLMAALLQALKSYA